MSQTVTRPYAEAMVKSLKARSPESLKAVIGELRESAKTWSGSPDEECQEDAVTLTLICDIIDTLTK